MGRRGRELALVDRTTQTIVTLGDAAERRRRWGLVHVALRVSLPDVSDAEIERLALEARDIAERERVFVVDERAAIRDEANT